MSNKTLFLILLLVACIPHPVSAQFKFNQNEKAHITAGISKFKWEINRLILETFKKDRPTIKQGDNVLIADTFINDAEKKSYYAYGNLYYSNPEQGIILRAGEGVYRSEDEIVIVTKSPRITMTKSKVTARSWKMHIFPNNNQIIMIGNVRIKGENYEITGNRATMNQDTGKIVITGDASTKQKDTIMKADRIVIDSKNSKIENYTATGNVSVNDPEKGFTIHAGKLEYFEHLGYSKITQDPWIDFKEQNTRAYSTVMEQYENEDKANLLGNVIIVQGSKVAFSKWGEYYSKSKKIFLTGRPILKEGESRFYANKITVEIESGLMKMEGVGAGFYNLKTSPSTKEK